mgnify:CR=1 FL=1
MEQRALAAEFIGTFALVAATCGSALFSAPAGGGLVAVAFAIGLSVLIMAYSVGHISGGHFNPAVTIGLIAAGRFDAAKAVSYIIAQLAGGIAAGEGNGYRGRRLGSVPYDAMPPVVAACDIGVAPYDGARLPQLALGFFWSPLKIFEYMAAGLPVVAPALPRLERLIESGKEGVLYDPREPRALDRALASLVDPAIRRAMGASARARVVREFSWAAHCRTLDEKLRSLVAR